MQQSMFQANAKATAARNPTAIAPIARRLAYLKPNLLDNASFEPTGAVLILVSQL